MSGAEYPCGDDFALYRRCTVELCFLLSTFYVRYLDNRGVYFGYAGRHWQWGDDVPAPELKGNPLVSILVPCFNEGLNARETIHAALAQTYTNIEVIAINDGSSDDTAQVLDALLAEDPRLRVIHLAHNQGKAIALRMGPRPPAVNIWSVSMVMPCWTRMRCLIWSRH